MNPRIRRALAGAWLASVSSIAAHAAPQPVTAKEALTLPGGGWLALEKNELQLIGADGAVRARHAVRGKSLDARIGADGRGHAVVIDGNAARVLPLAVDLGAGTLAPGSALPAARGIAATCLFRDAQGLDHVFVLGDNGLAEQWVLRAKDGESEALPVRTFAVAPKAEHCRADDARQTLYVSEPAGVWAHGAAAEAGPERRVVALRRPHGPLAESGPAIEVVAQGLAVGRGTSRRIFAQPAAPQPLPVVQPRAQTAQVAEQGDAADDPAIWVHPNDPAASLVLATDKKRGLAVYDLQGRELQFLPVGRINNVDLRRDVKIGGERLDIATATQRDEGGIVVFGIGADSGVRELARLPLGVNDIYGMCMRRTPEGDAEVFVNGKDGSYLQVRLERQMEGNRAGALVVRKLRAFRFASQPEGCAVDDDSGMLFAGEEKRGVWALSADAADAGAKDRKLILAAGGLLHADVEGMSVWRRRGKAYLVVSSQGNDSYVVLDAAPPFKVRGAFRVGLNTDAGIDGSSETDGLDVTALPLPGYPQGLLVVQDGRKRLPEGPQNFKYVSWEDVAKALGLP